MTFILTVSSEHSTVTYTSASEDDLDMGSPGVEVPIFEVPPSPDYIPGPEGPPSPDYVPGPRGSQAGHTFTYLHTFCSGPVYPRSLTKGNPPEEMMMMMQKMSNLAPPSPAAVAYQLTRDHTCLSHHARRCLPVHERLDAEMCLPLRKRPCRTTPGPGCEVGESSAAGAARQFGPTTAKDRPKI
ncbi:hypothetical protein Tco_0528395 [Tanacetum coccineum]